jgi:UrcA family protein
MDIFRRRTLRGVVSGILFGVAGLVRAGSPTEMVVGFADLNLGTHGGVATLYSRLEAAARIVCTAQEGSSSRDRITSCIDYSVRQAIAQIGAPRLVALYQTRTGYVVLRTGR